MELFAAAVLAFVTTCEGFECLGVGGSFFAFYLFSVLEVFEHGQFALGDKMFVEERLEGIEDGGSWEGLKPAFSHGGGVFRLGIPEHDADGEDEEFVSVEMMLCEHPAVNFEQIGFLHKFVCCYF